MTLIQMERRVRALEEKVQRISRTAPRIPKAERRWWVEDAGRFKDDPVFEEILDLGRRYRKSLKPRR